MPLLQVDNLVKHFRIRGGFFNRIIKQVYAVNGVSLAVEEGETLGIVGESGCGKTTLGKMIIRLIEPNSGTVRFGNDVITDLNHSQLRSVRKNLQFIFQDPYSSLNPRLTVRELLKEVIKLHRVVPREQIENYSMELLGKVGLHPDAADKYPHEFSGGQRQRIGIARALSLKPRFIVADEPVSALDVSIQAQILNLLKDLKEEFGLTVLFISHDLKVIEHFCDRIMVMYLGHVVESISSDNLHQGARHPYTQALLQANPINDPNDRKPLEALKGEVPSPFNPPKGCPFESRCPIAEARCHESMPPLQPIGAENHQVACWVTSPK
ncbi:MAG TPA: ABC transporter ATP-binding protein [Verrucomicrobiales bacterium]|nr:ABC transporter ATP-binding protein [Verrucomicrobiales bacterium]HIL69686.1 ABC transporter ATP-binding protein [Verrucomicrobiota bacterium]